MKKKLKQLWQRRPKLSRGWKTARNFILLIGLGLAIWFVHRCPALTSELALREMERKLFLAPGQTVYAEHYEGFGSDKQVFVLGDEYAYTGEISRYSLFDIGTYIHDEAEREDGPTLLRVRTRPVYSRVEGWDTILFCPWGPEDAVRVEATISTQLVSRTYPMIFVSEDRPYARGEMISCERENWEKVFFGAKREEGYFAIPVVAETQEDAEILSLIFTHKINVGTDTYVVERIAEGSSYRIDFYDAQDELVQSVIGELERFY